MTGDALDEIGRRRGARQSSDGHDYLTAYEAALTRAGTPSVIVLVLADGALTTACTFGERWPEAEVHVLHPRSAGEVVGVATGQDRPANVHVHAFTGPRERRDLQAVLPRPDLLVEAFVSETASKIAALRQMHGYVRAGGIYAVEGIDRAPGDRSESDAGPSVRAVIEDVVARVERRLPKRGWATWQDTVARTLAAVTYHRDLALLTKSEPLLRMLRTAETEPLLTARYGDDSPVETLLTHDRYTFTSRASITSVGEGPAVLEGELTVPTRQLRAYADVVTYPRQLVSYGDFWLPDTFRHQQAAHLGHHGLIRSGDRLTYMRPRWRPALRRRWDGGPLFYLDSEFAGHFGHVTTEVVSRLWGWDEARARHPELRPLMSLRPGQTDVPAFAREILAGFGIDPDSLVVQSGDEALEVPLLLAADPQFENPRYADLALGDTWRRIADGLGEVVSPVAAEKVFISRGGRRACLQGPRVERFFRRRGFAVVRPEHYSYGEQVRLFQQARIIAGYGGSGLFTMMHAPQARVVIISGDGYVAQNEALIAAVNGNDLHYFWGQTERRPPDPRKRKTVFADDFSFDLRRHARALRQLAH
ncbi:glycosyltransferase family 61 protein [Mumia sp. zg.B53]|uniref:glycosyltransferase family 61 protein n=1 Tax=Mumia sp. zg.B53 TaxID=2855449 RepID=UPI001C6F1FC9|nr:glycosyltransferase 61 family protein [Mumia sp. zg.B53]MBW9214123.1 glycosyltransferase family 61 protein [Mumia sp. zg.B53]